MRAVLARPHQERLQQVRIVDLGGSATLGGAAWICPLGRNESPGKRGSPSQQQQRKEGPCAFRRKSVLSLQKGAAPSKESRGACSYVRREDGKLALSRSKGRRCAFYEKKGRSLGKKWGRKGLTARPHTMQGPGGNPLEIKSRQKRSSPAHSQGRAHVASAASIARKR